MQIKDCRRLFLNMFYIINVLIIYLKVFFKINWFFFNFWKWNLIVCPKCELHCVHIILLGSVHTMQWKWQQNKNAIFLINKNVYLLKIMLYFFSIRFYVRKPVKMINAGFDHFIINYHKFKVDIILTLLQRINYASVTYYIRKLDIKRM